MRQGVLTGLKKYGRLDPGKKSVRAWLTDVLEEVRDAMVYINMALLALDDTETKA